MKKHYLKFLSLILSLLFLLPTVACAGRDDSNVDDEDDEPVNTSMSQLYVANYYGGLGDQWLKQVKTAFEKANTETVFESGKKGVQVHIYNDKTIDGTGLGATLANDSGDSNVAGNAIYFTESVSYYELVNSGLLADCTDIVTEKSEDYDLDGDGVTEKVSIEDKMDVTLKDYFKTSSGKYYGLPFWEGFFCMYYDVDLFDEYNYYFADVESTTLDGDVDNKSVGPDGKTGIINGIDYSQDDGLPATFDQFYTLLSMMRSDTIYPFVWTSQYADYFPKMFANIWVDLEGYEQAKLNVTFDGTATNLINVDRNGNVTKVGDTAITSGKNGNAYMLQKQAGKYNTLKFINNLLSNSLNYDPLSVGGGLSHVGAQERYIKSPKIAGKEGAQRIGMLIEGNWWENEADNVFTSMTNNYGSQWSRKNRRFAVLPTPKASTDKLGDPVMYELNRSACFINANTPQSQLPLAKAFFKFVHNNESLSTFNAVTSMPRPFSYTITESDMQKISYFGLNMYNHLKKAKIIFPRNSQDSFWLNNETYFSAGGSWGWVTKIDGQKREPSSIIGYFRNKTYTPEDWFNGLYSFHSDNWSNLVNG